MNLGIIFAPSLFMGHVCHKCVIIRVCVHVNNPSLTVSHVVSLTVPVQTAPVGTNPFEDDEDEEEEMATEQHTTVNHISVNKEEIKTLVNRRKKIRPPATFQSFSFSMFSLWITIHSSSLAIILSQLLCSFLLVSLSPPSGGRLLCCSAWLLEWHCTQGQCVSVLLF